MRFYFASHFSPGTFKKPGGLHRPPGFLRRCLQ